MTHIPTAWEKNLKELSESTEVVSAYAGSDVSMEINRMLESLCKSYQADLETVTPEGLTTLQTALRQTRAIQAVVNGQTNAYPKV